MEPPEYFHNNRALERTIEGCRQNIYPPVIPLTGYNYTKHKVKTKVAEILGCIFQFIIQTLCFTCSKLLVVLSNPFLWLIVQAVLSVLSEIFIYVVLGICSVIISMIAWIDDFDMSENPPPPAPFDKGSVNNEEVYDEMGRSSRAAPLEKQNK